MHSIFFSRAFDNNGDGYISKAEIKDAILRFGQTFSAEEADEMFKVFDEFFIFIIIIIIFFLKKRKKCSVNCHFS